MATPGAIKAGRAFIEVGMDKSKFVKGLRLAEAQLRQFGQQIQNLGMKFAQAGGVLTLPFAVSTKIFVDFDDQMKTVQAVTRATGAEFDRLTEKAKMLGRTTSFTAAQVASGMVVLGRQGFSSEEIDKSITGVLSLARATATDLSEAAMYASDTLRGFGMDAGQMNRVVDVMTAAANNSAQSLEDLGQSMKYAAPIAQKYGSTLEETANALGILANVGIKGSLAGTGLRTSMARLADPKIRKELYKIGVSVGDASGNLRDFSQVMKEIGKATEKMGSVERLAILGKIFGRRAMSAGASLTTESFVRLEKAIYNSAGIAKKTMNVMESGLGGSFRRLRSAIEGVAIAIGKSLEKPLMVASKIIKDISLRIVQFINKNNKLVAQIAAIGVGLLAAGTSLIGLGFALKAVAIGLSGIKIAFTMGTRAALVAKIAIKALAGAFALITTGGGLVVATLAGITAAFIAFNKKARNGVNSIAADFTSASSKIKTAWIELVYLINQGNISKSVELAWAGIKAAWLEGVLKLTEAWIGFKTAVITSANEMAIALVSSFFKAQEKIKEFFVEMKKSDSLTNLLEIAPLTLNIESTEQTIRDAERRIEKWKKEGYVNQKYQSWVEDLKIQLEDMKARLSAKWEGQDEEYKKHQDALKKLQERNNQILEAIRMELKSGMSDSDRKKLSSLRERANSADNEYMSLLFARKNERITQKNEEQSRMDAMEKGGAYLKKYEYEKARRERLEQIDAAKENYNQTRQSFLDARKNASQSNKPELIELRKKMLESKEELDRLKNMPLPRRSDFYLDNEKSNHINSSFSEWLSNKFGGGGLALDLSAVSDKLSATGSFSGFARFGLSGESTSADRTANATETIARNTSELVRLQQDEQDDEELV